MSIPIGETNARLGNGGSAMRLQHGKMSRKMHLLSRSQRVAAPRCLEFKIMELRIGSARMTNSEVVHRSRVLIKSTGAHQRSSCRNPSSSLAQRFEYKLRRYDRDDKSLKSQSRKAMSSDSSSSSMKDSEEGSIDNNDNNNNNNNNNNNDKLTSSSDDNDGDCESESEDPSSTVAAVLESQRLSASSLPRDMQVALAKGLLSTHDITKYVKVMQMPLFEEAIGLTAKTSAEVDARKDKFWKEIDFVISDLALELAGNFFLVWLLSPRRIFTPSAGLAGFLNSLPSHASQIGMQFSMKQRGIVPLVKAGQFFCVGVGSGLIGYALTLALFQLKSDEAGENLRPPPPFKNSLAWGSFLAISSSIRYQIVNGVEDRVLDTLIKNNNASKIISFCLRFSNCYLGGQQWVAFVRAIGIQ